MDPIKLLVGDWRPNTWHKLWGVRIAIVFGVLFAVGYPYGITLWDWMKLLVVPAVLASIGLWFNRTQYERQRADNKAQHDLQLEIEDERAQDQALEAYLDRIGQRMHDLQEAKTNDQKLWAQAQTSQVLSRLGGKRKGTVVRFLYGAGLIGNIRPSASDTPDEWWDWEKHHGILRLIDADLECADLSNAGLLGADLFRARLICADLHGATLRRAQLSRANLASSDLSSASLTMADMSGADLSGAKLLDAELIDANLSETDLSGADLSHANLAGINISGANLSEVNLEGANLVPNMSFSTFSGRMTADGEAIWYATIHEGDEVSNTYPEGEELEAAKAAWAEKQLFSATSLKGATMPNGQKYEDWVKGKEQDQQNSAPS